MQKRPTNTMPQARVGYLELGIALERLLRQEFPQQSGRKARAKPVEIELLEVGRDRGEGRTAGAERGRRRGEEECNRTER